jgi:hypothetical protein
LKRFSMYFIVHLPIQIVFLNNFENCRSLPVLRILGQRRHSELMMFFLKSTVSRDRKLVWCNRHARILGSFTCSLSSNLTLKVNLSAEQLIEWENRINSTVQVLLSHPLQSIQSASFLFSLPNWVPHPLTHKGMLLLLPLAPRGETHLLVGGPSSDEGTYTLVLYVYYCIRNGSDQLSPNLKTFQKPSNQFSQAIRLAESIRWNRFQGFLNIFKIGLSDSMTAKADTLTHSTVGEK